MSKPQTQSIGGFGPGGRALTRRDFLGTGATFATGATLAWMGQAYGQGVPLNCVPPPPNAIPTPFVSVGSLPVRARKSVFELSAQEGDRLKAAYDALRQLRVDRPEDPRNWLGQGLVHCWYCSGSLDALTGPEIHGGWWFLPWHRAYLYFHERILGDLIEDPSFALPYWDWDTPQRNRFPDLYMTPNDPSNPLFDTFRAATAADRIPNDPTTGRDLVGPQRMAAVLGQVSFDLFGGAGEGASGQLGALEGAPHGGVHLWVTNPATLVPAQINMGVLGTAALDPVFYAHHANIDRLWEVWLASDPTHANPANDEWVDGQFFFYDHARQWTSISVADVVDTQASLRYLYEPPTTASPAVAVASPEAPSGGTRAAPVTLATERVVEFAGDDPKPLPPEPTTLRASWPGEMARAAAAAASEGGPRYILRIDGVRVPLDEAVLLRVFLNQPDATAETGPTGPHFAGDAIILPRTIAAARQTGQQSVTNLAFDVTDQLPLVAEGDEIAVTIVPYLGDGSAPAGISVTYRSVYIATAPTQQ
jgi:polyphenol oxidase